MQMLDPSGQFLDPNQEYLFQDYHNFARRSVEKYFKISEDEEEEYEEDDDEFLPLSKAIRLLHNLLLVARTPRSPAETTSSDQIAALIPEMRETTQNWPASRAYTNQICNDAGLSKLVISERNANGPFYLVGLFIFSRETVGNNSKVKIEKG
ncbi:hypothetical protein FOYG_04258 [Fusarium oxysporum NRRL 32931]|uniref:Uncharacterized protein n=1 Tax=Fusarium oxysporum NRRL 32931 TaxID=660029 RepID=W9IJL5_FUSOX|nr:hypothetical protein FOYG_04258 [Fusarium oxysporum NRRL 32931]